MSKDRYYVWRFKEGRGGYVGPLSESRAAKERDAWMSCGWESRMMVATADVRKLVREWQKDANERRQASPYAV